MKKRIVFTVLGCALPILLASSILVYASSAEVEPNNSPATANILSTYDTMVGSIDPIGDVDYYKIDGINTYWGYIALLDTISSTTSKQGTLTALGSDGVTVLQSDTGSWERGSGIAFQGFINGSDPLYLMVGEQGNNAKISSYSLRYFPTYVSTKPEIEPNNTYDTATPSAITHEGFISTIGDVDCFDFQGRKNDKILIAVNSKGSTIDPSLKLLSPSQQVMKFANKTGIGGSEFIEYTSLPVEGVYAYCVEGAGGLPGLNARYVVGIVRNGELYFPSYNFAMTWVNPKPRGYVEIGDQLSFRLAMTNTSPLDIPQEIMLSTAYSSTCLSLVSAVPPATYTAPGFISWSGQKIGLAAGEVYSVLLNLKAEKTCTDIVNGQYAIEYYASGSVNRIENRIRNSTYLPFILTKP